MRTGPPTRAGPPRDQAQGAIGGLEHHCTAIRAGLGKVERRPRRPLGKTSVLGEKAPEQRLLPRGGLRLHAHSRIMRARKDTVATLTLAPEFVRRRPTQPALPSRIAPQSRPPKARKPPPPAGKGGLDRTQPHLARRIGQSANRVTHWEAVPAQDAILESLSHRSIDRPESASTSPRPSFYQR